MIRHAWRLYVSKRSHSDWVRSLSAAICCWLVAQQAVSSHADHPRSWAAVYGKHAATAALAQPDWLVLEPDHGWRLATFKRPGQRVLAYLSLGEVHESRDYFQALAANRGALLGRNPHWPGAWRVNPEHTVWRDMLVERLVGSFLAMGYDGLFLDTLDAAEELERSKALPGARQAMIDLVALIHARYPQARIVANGGLALVPAIVPCLSAFAVESIVTDYDFERKAYRWRQASEARSRVAEFQALQHQYGLPVLVLEYRPAGDRVGRVRATTAMRAAGFVPFVSGIDLDQLPGSAP